MTIQTHDVKLDIGGMTCASCANRIEKKLNKVDGVTATVNYATEQATVSAPVQTSTQDLISVVEQAGYQAAPVSEEPPTERADVLRPRMIGAFVLGAPVVAVSMVPALQFPGWQWVSMVLAIVVVYWFGRSFHAAAWANLRHGTTTMDTLVSLGTNAAMIWSMVALFFGSAGHIGMRHEFSFSLGHSDPMGNIYFEAAVAIVAFLLLGRYIEAKSKKQAGAAVRALLEVGAKEAIVLRDGKEVSIPAAQLTVDELFVVRAGAKVAADGEVVEGYSALDASVITGESEPVEVSPGTKVVGGSINTTGRLVVRATAVGSKTQLAQISQLVEQAQTGKANAQRLADKITGFFVPTVILIAIGTFIVQWALLDAGLTFALTAAISVLIIACPCALGLATPSALLAGTGRGAQLGIILRGPQTLERARSINQIVFDKTGTITTGKMSVVDVRAMPDQSTAELLAVAAALEAGSDHPIGLAIIERAESLAVVERATATDHQNLPGRGITAQVSLDGASQQLAGAGSNRLLAELGIVEPDLELPIGSQVFVTLGDRLLGVVVVADTLKPDVRPALAKLQQLGLTPSLLTGDRQQVAAAIAAEAGISQVKAEVLPSEKAGVIDELRAGGNHVAMVGDGVNDAAALASADLGISMGAGTDAAIAASDITVMRNDLMSVVDAVRLSRATNRIINSNLVWAFAYNLAALPIAAAGLLTPMIAGAAMACSSVFVVLNSLRLRRFKPEPRA